MSFRNGNKIGFNFMQQEFPVSLNSYTYPNSGPFVWYPVEVIGSETNTSFSTITNYPIVFQPPTQQTDLKSQ